MRQWMSGSSRGQAQVHCESNAYRASKIIVAQGREVLYNINMPRRGRIDYPGALHHIMVRGMEQRKLFKDDKDRRVFLNRLGRFLESTSTKCHAYALMPNHFHLLVVTGESTTSALMQSLLTSYAAYFNRRHDRRGKLYENRYKSILCDKYKCGSSH